MCIFTAILLECPSQSSARLELDSAPPSRRSTRSSLAVRDSWHQAARWAPCLRGTEEPAGERLAWASFPEMRRLFPCLGIGKVVVEGQRGGELQNGKLEVFWWWGTEGGRYRSYFPDPKI